MNRYGKGRAALARSRRWMALAACSALAACAVVTSETLETLSKNGAEPTGVSYALPMGLVDITLFVKETTAEYRIDIKEVFIADPTRRYVMRYQPLPNYKDSVEIVVSSNSLLSKVHVTTKDETGAIVVALAKLADNLFQSAPVPSGFDKLANVTIDATDPNRVKHAAVYLSEQARSNATRKYSISCSGVAATAEACRRYRQIARIGCSGPADTQEQCRPYNPIEITVDHPARIGVTEAATHCSAGLCYRVKEPYVLRYAIDEVRGAKIINLPNRAPVIELDITRAFLVSKIQEIDFDKDGFLKSALVKKDSEVLALSALPINVITAISEKLPVRLTIQQKQVELAQQQLALSQALDDKAAAGKDPN
jgi:hypothetical protein